MPPPPNLLCRDADALVARYSRPDRMLEVCEVRGSAPGQRNCTQGWEAARPPRALPRPAGCPPVGASQHASNLWPAPHAHPSSPPQVCGLFMQSTDSESRKRDHIEGKQYQGAGLYVSCCRAAATGRVLLRPMPPPAPEAHVSSHCAPSCCLVCSLAGWLAIRQKHKELQQKLGPGGGVYPPLGARV